MELGVLIFCCIRNYFRARAANLSAALWSFYTFLACLCTWFVGGIIMVIIMIFRDSHLRNMLQQQTSQDKIIEYLAAKNLVVPQLFLLVCMIGGYLLVRYLLIRRQSLPNSD